MKRIGFIVLGLTAMLMVFSCMPNVELVNTGEFESITIKAPNFVMGDPMTKTNLTISDTEGAVFSWKAGDIVGICPDVGTQVRFPIIENTGANTNQAKFTGGGWAVKGAHTYMAYYPFISDMELDKTAIPVDYTGQVQAGSGTTGHLSNFDYMAAAASAPSDGEIMFDFKHLGALLVIDLTVPKIAEYNKMILTCNEVPFVTKGTVDISASTPAISGTEYSQEFVVNLSNVVTTARDQVVTVIAMIAPVDMSGKEIKVRLEGSHAFCETSFTRGEGKPFVAGKAYRPLMNQEPNAGEIVLVERGDAFNAALKTLANGEEFNQSRYDHMIKHLVIQANVQHDQLLPDETVVSVMPPYVEVSAPESSDNIYAVWDSSTSTMTLRTPADKLYINDNAEGMFSRLEVLEDITGMEYLSSEYTANMTYLFNECRALKAIDLSHLKMTKDKSMNGMFGGCASLTSLDLSTMDSSEEISFHRWFHDCSSLTNLNLGGTFSTASAQDLSAMFWNCSSLRFIDLSNFNTQKVQSTGGMFVSCTSLESIDLSSFDGKNVQSTEAMFYNCQSLQSIDLSSFITPKNVNMAEMFSDCSHLTRVIFGENYDTHNVEDMHNMFSGCGSLVELDLSVFRTPNLRNMSQMFSHGTNVLKRLDMRNFDTTNCLSLMGMFAISECHLEKWVLGNNFVIRDVNIIEDIQSGSTLPHIDKMVCRREVAEMYATLIPGWTRFELIDEAVVIYKVGTFSDLNNLLGSITDSIIHLIQPVHYDMYLPYVSVDLNGKTIISDVGLAFNMDLEGDRTVCFTGSGTVKQSDDYSGEQPLILITGGKIIINGGEYVNNSSSTETLRIGAEGTSPTVEVNAGTLKNLSVDSQGTSKVFAKVTGSTPAITVNGGTFYCQDPSNYVNLETHTVNTNADGSFTVVANSNQ